MRLSDWKLFIQLISCVQSGLYFLPTSDRSTAAAYATAGTSHYFNEMIIGFACSYLTKHFACIAQAVNNRYFYFQSININDSLFYATYLCKVQSWKFFACNDLIYSTQRSFHNTACSAKNFTGTASQTKWCIKRSFFQLFKINTCCFNHICKFYNS